jgi:hypothetical protein
MMPISNWAYGFMILIAYNYRVEHQVITGRWPACWDTLGITHTTKMIKANIFSPVFWESPLRGLVEYPLWIYIYIIYIYALWIQPYLLKGSVWGIIYYSLEG